VVQFVAVSDTVVFCDHTCVACCSAMTCDAAWYSVVQCVECVAACCSQRYSDIHLYSIVTYVQCVAVR